MVKLWLCRVVDEQILEGCTSVLEELLELSAGKLALDKFLAESHFSSVLLNPPISGDVKSSSLPTHIIKFFIKLFQLGELCTDCYKVKVIYLGAILLRSFLLYLQRKRTPQTTHLPQCAAEFQWDHGWNLASCKAGCPPTYLLHHLQVMVKLHQQVGSCWEPSQPTS